MRRIIVFGLIVASVVTVGGLVVYSHYIRPAVVDVRMPVYISPSTPSPFNTQLYSLTDPASQWVIVNKQHPLTPKTYVPSKAYMSSVLVVPHIPQRAGISSDERQVAIVMAPDLERMAQAASHDGLKLNLQSGYRSYDFQVGLYNAYAARDGQAAADRYSARPGYSEHQTGLAADLGGVTNPSCNVAACFVSTPEGVWLAAHAHTYGFILRYTADKEAVTGYEYEPWHFRYVGIELAAQMHNRGIATLEEFFKVSGGQAYTF